VSVFCSIYSFNSYVVSFASSITSGFSRGYIIMNIWCRCPICVRMRVFTELQVSDSGIYTCLAVSETGETSWSSRLQVRHPSSQSIVFHRMPDASTFPAAPTRPSINLVTETSVSLSWQPNDNHGASPVNSYAVEYFSQRSSTVSISLSFKPISQLRFDYDTTTTRRYHDAFDSDRSDRNYDSTAI